MADDRYPRRRGIRIRVVIRSRMCMESIRLVVGRRGEVLLRDRLIIESVNLRFPSPLLSRGSSLQTHGGHPDRERLRIVSRLKNPTRRSNSISCLLDPLTGWGVHRVE